MVKKKIQKVMASVYEKYGQDKTAEIADDLKDLAFEYATVSGLSMGMEDFPEIKGLHEVVDGGEFHAAEISQQYEAGFVNNEERYRLTIENWMKVDNKVQQLLSEQLSTQDNSMSIAVKSGARGNISQMKYCVGMLGVVSDTSGRAIELPIKSGYKQGLKPLEYFTGTRGTRKALIDIALKTADSGYLTRRLVDVSQDVFTIDEEVDDPGFSVYRKDAELIGVDYATKLEGRFTSEIVKIDGKKVVGKGELITKSVAKQIQDSDLYVVKIMSVLTSNATRGVSRKSYGVDPATGQLVEGWHPVGVIAAQSLGEPATQLSLDSKHRAGAVMADETAQGLNRVEELFEARAPKGEAYIAELDGTVTVWEDGEQYIVQITGEEEKQIKQSLAGRKPTVKDDQEVAIGDVIASKEKGEEPLVASSAGKVVVTDKTITVIPKSQSTVRYEIPGYKQIEVKDGDQIKVGDKITNGSINLHELMRLKGIETTQRYIMNEISKIFATQGQNISDKHLEIVIRQMFSRVTVDDPGESRLVTGDIISRAAILEANQTQAERGKKLAEYTPMLLGITKVSTQSDSFLSAASFQDTTRVLIAAATSGKVDKLYGLKENVILGRRIPVGTGHKVDEIQEDVDGEE
jgi:DNA-directed RNA polymerase subunit beta'